MANNINALDDTASTASNGFNIAQVSQNSGGNDQRPTYNSAWKRQASSTSTTSSNVNSQIKSPGVQQSQANLNQQFSFYSISSSNPSGSFDFRSPNSFSPSGNVSPSAQGFANVYEPTPQPYWETEANWEDVQFDGEEHRTDETSGYSQQEYYPYPKPPKQKGLSFKIDRFVQRIPALGKFYKQPPASPNRQPFDHQFSYNSSAELIDHNELARELTADELALQPRYSNKTYMKVINLQRKDETQPVDLRIYHGKNHIYLCDVGRSIVEIYDLNGIRQHSINDATMTKFQPTAITVASDGTVILASHFNHCLYMYSPNNTHMGIDYSYKQFKLGTQGNLIHQFYQPAGIAIDRNDGYLYVCDRGNYRIQVMRPEGFCERVIQLFLNTKKKYPLDPIRVAIQNKSELIVCIIGNGDSICFIPKNSNGKLNVDPLYILDENGLGLENASGLAVDSEDRIYISDTGHHRIVICTPDGSYITSFGSEGDGLGQLKRPCGLDLTNNGILVVTDPGNKRLHLFGLIKERPSVENNPQQENLTEIEQNFINHL